MPMHLEEPLSHMQKVSEILENTNLDNDQAFSELYHDAAALRMQWDKTAAYTEATCF